MATRAFPGNADCGEIAASVPLLIVLALRFFNPVIFCVNSGLLS